MSRFRIALLSLACVAVCITPAVAEDNSIEGDYMEVRDCDIYTGPCFANGQIGLAGKQAILAWGIEQGQHDGVDLSGLNVILVVNASDTLTFGGWLNSRPEPIQSVILVDSQADDIQREALVDFVQQHAEQVTGEIRRVDAIDIEMAINHVNMESSLVAGDVVQMSSRKLDTGDCVCSNEILFYPPLAEVQNAAAAFTLDAGFQGAGLRVKWTQPGTRSTYLATFAY